MSKWNIYTPEGIQDILFEECATKREIENITRRLFVSSGFREIEPPTIEFYDVFSENLGSIDQQSMFKFFDQNGRILVLRPDITTAVARIAATKLGELAYPVKLSYIGNVFRFDEIGAGRLKQREFTQAGVEIVGSTNYEADAEVISTVIEAIRQTGLKNFQIEIGQVEFFRGLMEQAGFADDENEKIRVLIENKDYFGIESALEDKEIDDNLRQIIMKLPEMFGAYSIIDDIYEKVSNKRSKDALDNLKGICDILREYDYEQYISIDLGMVQSIDYYTGMIFKGLAHGVGFSICGGGRYDKLTQKFGKAVPSTGGAIGINRLMLALGRQKVKVDASIVETLVTYSPKGRRLAIKIVQELRKQGVLAELKLGESSPEESSQYAKSKEIKGIIFVEDDEKIKLYDLVSGSITEKTIKDIINLGK